MVSNEDIKKKLVAKRVGRTTEGFLICESCGNYYQLQEGESINDFESCHCGGKLRFIESIDISEATNAEEGTQSEGRFIVCNKCAYFHELIEDENSDDFRLCECGGKFKFYRDREEYFSSKEYLESFLDSNKSSTKNVVSKTVNKLIKGETIEDKQSKYGFLIGAKGIEGRLELYDYWIRLPGKEYLLIEDISSIDFQRAHGIRGRGYIKFNLKGMDRVNKQKGPIVTYNPRTGFGIGLAGIKDGKVSMLGYNPRTGFNLGLGVFRGAEPPKVHFSKKSESKFREIRDMIYNKILESKV
ncbi:MAG: hypothetical protein HVN35_10675 [Methanobacteriaceae archaeon]|nr:hypothetical protein [Methanobacteriaceae archaeon]